MVPLSLLVQCVYTTEGVRQRFGVSKPKWRSDTQSRTHKHGSVWLSARAADRQQTRAHIRDETQTACRRHGLCCVTVAQSAGQRGSHRLSREQPPPPPPPTAAPGLPRPLPRPVGVGGGKEEPFLHEEEVRGLNGRLAWNCLHTYAHTYTLTHTDSRPMGCLQAAQCVHTWQNFTWATERKEEDKVVTRFQTVVLCCLYECAVCCLGRSPSSSSRLAPPPVLTWLTLSSVFHLAQQVAVSPPPGHRHWHTRKAQCSAVTLKTWRHGKSLKNQVI